MSTNAPAQKAAEKIDQKAAEKPCPVCGLAQQSKNNYCPSCGHSFIESCLAEQPKDNRSLLARIWDAAKRQQPPSAGENLAEATNALIRNIGFLRSAPRKLRALADDARDALVSFYERQKRGVLTFDGKRDAMSPLHEAAQQPPSAGEWTVVQSTQVGYGDNGEEFPLYNIAIGGVTTFDLRHRDKEDLQEMCNKINAEMREAERAGFRRGLTWYERSQKAGEILVRRDQREQR